MRELLVQVRRGGVELADVLEHFMEGGAKLMKLVFPVAAHRVLVFGQCLQFLAEQPDGFGFVRAGEVAAERRFNSVKALAHLLVESS